MTSCPCCGNGRDEYDEPPRGEELPAGDMKATQAALSSPSDPHGVERVAAGWAAAVEAERGAA